MSLYPLSFKEAVSGLAQVKMPEPQDKKPTKKGPMFNFLLWVCQVDNSEFDYWNRRHVPSCVILQSGFRKSLVVLLNRHSYGIPAVSGARLGL